MSAPPGTPATEPREGRYPHSVGHRPSLRGSAVAVGGLIACAAAMSAVIHGVDALVRALP